MATLPVYQPSAFQTFLKLRQPIEEASYPEPRVFQQGSLYRFPFTFVVPEQLLPQSCSHRTCNQHLQHAHTQLPPSLGDPMMASDGQSLLDDMAPKMSQISYMIRVTVRKSAGEDNELRTLASVAKKVRIIPASVEQPPLEIVDNLEGYCTRREKDVRRGLLRGKMGRLVVAASQPKALQLLAPGVECSGPVCSSNISSAVTLHLRFDPEDHTEQPPRLGSLLSKMKVLTFYSSKPWTAFPARSRELAWDSSQGVYTETIALASRCVASAQWEKHSSATAAAAGDTSRCSSLQSTSSVDTVAGPSASYAGKSFYTASIIVPISLPADKAFVPTFHSCLISRVYMLDLSLTYHTPNANVLAPSISLRLPIQITSAHREGSLNHLSDAVLSQMQIVDEFFEPRSVAPPSPEYLERAGSVSGRPSADSDMSMGANSVEPPAYSALPRQRRREPAPSRETSLADFALDRTIQTTC
jgi:hypothetical protein